MLSDVLYQVNICYSVHCAGINFHMELSVNRNGCCKGNYTVMKKNKLHMVSNFEIEVNLKCTHHWLVLSELCDSWMTSACCMDFFSGLCKHNELTIVLKIKSIFCFVFVIC